MKRQYTEQTTSLINRLNRGLPKRNVLRERMRALQAEGWRLQEIAEYYGVAPPTVNEIINPCVRSDER